MAGSASTPDLPTARAQGDMTQDEVDRHWLENVYKPHERQLTVRAIVAGMLLGGVLSVANLYIGLKVGWAMGMALTATILAFAAMKSLQAAGIIKGEFTQLENNTVASTSSAAGYFSSAGLISAIPALYITTQRTLSWWELALWMSAVSFIGIVMAVPMRRQMIDVERLRFPAGTACAETIKAMHESATEAVVKARALLYGGLFGVLLEIPSQVAKLGVRDNPIFYGGTLKLPWVTIAGQKLYAYGIALPTSSLLFGAGAIMGIRVGLSMGIAALVLFGVITPWLAAHGIVTVNVEGVVTYRSVMAWSVWPGVLGALAASLLHFGLKWRTIAQAFGSLGKLARSGGARTSRMAEVEVPGSWFVIGLIASTALVALAAKIIFGIQVWMSVLAVALSFVLSIVACRSTGETDVNPIGALGKITQLTFAGIHPGNYYTNLMTGSITAGAAAHSADLLTDLKTGYLLGGSPRRQFIAQFFGILAGAVFCTMAYRVVVGDGETIGAKFPAPSAQTWAVFADLLSNGIENADRGPAEVVPATVQAVTVVKRPAGVLIGDTLRITEGPNAGAYAITGFERRVFILDRDVPVAMPDATGQAAPFAAEIVGPDGSLRGGAAIAVAANAADKPAVRFTRAAAGTRVGDYVRVDAAGGPLYHQIKAVRGDLVMLDHAFMVATDQPTAVAVFKSTLPPYAGLAVLIAIIAGLVITLLEIYGPPRIRPYLPSMAGIGVAFVITAFDSLAMATGAVFGYILARAAPKLEERYNVPASSGIIAGASIAGLVLTVLSLIGWITLG